MLLSVGQSVGLAPERDGYFKYSQYSMGSSRGEAHHNSRVGGSGEEDSSPLPQEMQWGSEGGHGCPIKQYQFSSVFISARTVLH